MAPLILFLHTSVACFAGFTLLWLWQTKSQDASWVDVLWGASIGVVSIYTFLVYAPHNLRHFIILLCPLFWSIRLSYHLTRRLLFLKSEDSRYHTMREQSKHPNQMFFVFYMVQAVFVLVFSAPIIVALLSPASHWLMTDTIALIIFIVALTGESIADKQLLAHRRENGSTITCQKGLWYYSRHPNYFFEWIHWFAYAFFSVSSSALWLAASMPFIMLLFLIKVTGIPHAEREALKKKPDYAEYQRTTSMFIPWFKKKI